MIDLLSYEKELAIELSDDDIERLYQEWKKEHKEEDDGICDRE